MYFRNISRFLLYFINISIENWFIFFITSAFIASHQKTFSLAILSYSSGELHGNLSGDPHRGSRTWLQTRTTFKTSLTGQTVPSTGIIHSCQGPHDMAKYAANAVKYEIKFMRKTILKPFIKISNFYISKYLYGFLDRFHGRCTRFQGSWRPLG